MEPTRNTLPLGRVMQAARDTTPIAAVRARAYTIPTDGPEADGTFEWNATTIVVVEIDAGGCTGLGYTYSDACVAALISRTLAPELLHAEATSIHALGARLRRRVRNLGRAGLAATAISAIDCALWDLNARLLEQPLVNLLGGALRERVPIYGSGGFTNYTDAQLREQFSYWVERDGCRAVKMKIGRDPRGDVSRVECARRAIGDAALFVDANGALSVKSALACACRLAEFGVAWFEEPVSSDDLAGLAAVRGAAPVTIDVAAGEYAYTADDFRRLLETHAVDVVQADITRCGGVTGFLQAAALCDAAHVPLSAHCAPALHVHAACAVPGLRHQEWFHDHARIEAMLFDGAPLVRDGSIAPDLSRPGCGLALKHRDAERFALSG